MSFTNQKALYPMRAFSNTTSAVIASQSTTVSTAAVGPTGFTAMPAVDGVGLVTFDVQDNTVRCRWDGVDPTSTVGHILYAGNAYTWDIAQYNAAKFIRISTASGDAVIFASPFQF